MKFLSCFGLVFFVLTYKIECQVNGTEIEGTDGLRNSEGGVVIADTEPGVEKKNLPADSDKVTEVNDQKTQLGVPGNFHRSVITNVEITNDSGSSVKTNKNFTSVQAVTVEKEIVVIEICHQCYCNESMFKNVTFLEITCLHVENELNFNQILWPANEKGLDIEVTFQGLGLTSVPELPRNRNIVLISFYDNLITSVFPRALSTLKNLMVLSFKKNDIVKISPDMFEGLKQVEELDLSSNHLKDFSPLDFTELISLKKLFLKQNLLKVLPVKALNNIPSLEYLDCSYNEIYSIDLNFDVNFMKNLKVLDLSYNKLTIIYTNQLSSGFSLTSLDISNNEIATIEPNSFDNCTNLKDLWLSRNRITSLPTLPLGVESVFLQNNRLSQWPNIPTTIRHLDISNNEIYQMSDESAPILDKIETINISGNHLSDFNFKEPLSNVKILDFSYNRLEKVPKNFNKKILPLINDLYIDGNPLKELIFTEEIELRKLSAKDLDSIESLDEMSFKNVIGRLQSIRNNSEEISCIDIAVSQCKKLTKIPEKTFQNVSLCHLDISDNQLRSLTNATVDWVNIPRGVNLQGNPWDCECHMQWLLDGLLGNLVNNHPMLLHDLRCNTPRSVKRMRIVHWYNWKVQAFCRGNLFFGRSSSYTLQGSTDNYNENDEIWTPKTIGLLIGILVLGLFVVILTIYLIKGRSKYNRTFRLLMQKKRQTLTDVQKMNKNGDNNQNNALMSS